VWPVLALASTGDYPPALATAQDAAFRQHLPMARTLAPTTGSGGQPVGPVHAEQAVHIGLAQAVLGWRRPDSTGFELFAGIASRTQLDRLAAADRPGHLSPGEQSVAGDESPPGPG
jgi:hypothetical protein